MMTLKRLLSIIGTVIHRDTRRRSRGLIPARCMACVLNVTRILYVKGRMSPQLRQTCGNVPKNAGLAFNKNCVPPKVAPLQQGQSRA